MKKQKSSLAFLAIAILLAITPFFSTGPEAQTNSNDWSSPINLSNSGSTQDPLIIQDSEGVFHVIWKDNLNGFFYVDSKDGQIWSKPLQVNFPFSIDDNSPVLISDQKGYIHAFWTNIRYELSYSQVLAGKFGDFKSWSNKQDLAESALDFDVAISHNDNINVTYVRGINAGSFPAGIYYKQSIDGGLNWRESLLLYESGYLRSLSTENANVHIATSTKNSTDLVYVVWDNSSLQSIYFTKSMNGGKDWTPPQLLRGPNLETGDQSPMFINVVANEKNVVITWQLSQGNSMCEQYSQWSGIDDTSWNDPMVISQKLTVCSKESKFLLSTDDFVLYMSNIVGRLSLLAWNGSLWSDPVNTLKSFFDKTVNKPVILNGQNTIIDNDRQQIYTVGYDEGVGGDIWLSTLSLASLRDRFPSSSKWSQPEVITSSVDNFSSLKLISDENEKFHTFWLQKDILDTSQEKSKIYYSFWDGQQWSLPVSILTSTESDVLKIDVAVKNQRIFLVWEEGATGKIFFSWADVEEARNPVDWVSPIQLSEEKDGGSNPSMFIDPRGFIYVAYAVPVNDNRGVYILKSGDKGISWTKPIRVAGSSMLTWEIVDTPFFTVGIDQSVSVIWTLKSFSGRSERVSLYANQSFDEGVTWGNAEKIEEGILSYVGLAGVDSQNIHRFWLKKDLNKNNNFWHQYSKDGGISWSLPSSPLGIIEIIGTPTVVTDRMGRIHLFVIESEGSLSEQVNHLVWENEKWMSDTALSVSNHQGVPISDVFAAISSSGKIFLNYTGKILDGSSRNLINTLFYSNRTIDFSTAAPISEFNPTDAVPGITPSAITLTILPTPTIVQTEHANNQNFASSSSELTEYSGVLIGVGLTGFLVSIFFVFFLVKRKRQE